MDDVIAPANGGTPYVINYIDDSNKQFSPTMEGHISLEELEHWLKWRTLMLQYAIVYLAISPVE